MANLRTEFHDSTLAVLWYEQSGEAVLIFRWLYIHQSEGRPGIDDGVGWFQRAELVIENASLTEFTRAWPCEIYGGEAVIDGISHRNGFPLPIPRDKNIKIVLDAIDDDNARRRIEIEGSGARLTLLDEKRSFEKFSGSGARD